MVRGFADADKHDLGHIGTEKVKWPRRRLAAARRLHGLLPLRVNDFLGSSGNLGVAPPRLAGVGGRTVQGEAGVAPQVERLSGVSHRAQP